MKNNPHYFFQAIAVMVGLCYFGTKLTTQVGIQNVEGAIFLIVTENTFTPMYAIVNEFPQKYPLFLREYKAGLYSSAIYFLSRIFSNGNGIYYLLSLIRRNDEFRKTPSIYVFNRGE
jgi:hypothetical protein